MIEEIEKIRARSMLIRHRSMSNFSDLIGVTSEDGSLFISDSDALMLKRFAEDHYLDFPGVLRGAVKEGSIRYDSLVDETDLGDFFSLNLGKRIFVFIEPWVIRGAVLINANIVEDRLWSILEYSDYSIKMYNDMMTNSCIIKSSDRENYVQFSMIL